MTKKTMRSVINVIALLKFLQHIQRDPKVSRRELAGQLDLSGASITRLFQAARDVFGVRWDWDMVNGYNVTDWGVIDPRKLRSWKAPD